MNLKYILRRLKILTVCCEGGFMRLPYEKKIEIYKSRCRKIQQPHRTTTTSVDKTSTKIKKNDLY